jgi:hypothetical protein
LNFVHFLAACNAVATAGATLNPPIYNPAYTSLDANYLTLGIDYGLTTTRTNIPVVYVGSCRPLEVTPVVGAVSNGMRQGSVLCGLYSYSFFIVC